MTRTARLIILALLLLLAPTAHAAEFGSPTHGALRFSFLSGIPDVASVGLGLSVPKYVALEAWAFHGVVVEGWGARVGLPITLRPKPVAVEWQLVQVGVRVMRDAMEPPPVPWKSMMSGTTSVRWVWLGERWHGPEVMVVVGAYWAVTGPSAIGGDIRITGGYAF